MIDPKDPTDPGALSPVPQTQEAFDWLGNTGDEGLEHSVMSMAERVRAIAPQCVALSVSVLDGDLTFTVKSNRPGATLLDAVQYLAGGPCIDAVQQQKTITSQLPLDEERWQMFARAGALAGISSTLSLPIIGERQIIGGVNLYGATADAFDGRHEELASACGAWAKGAVTNADLGFNSRVRAAATPGRLFDRGVVDLAKGLLSEVCDITPGEAGNRIRSAAVQAGVSEAEFGQFLLDVHAGDVEQQSKARGTSD